ncbi:MAG: hypothetical protein JOZ43_04760 [Acidobacteriales bacterium]|nr:hypothetical protein [Terriglobales bacterium]
MKNKIVAFVIAIFGALALSSPAAAQANAMNQIEAMSGWQVCSACAGVAGKGPVASYWLQQHVGSPSMNGNSSQYHIGGSRPYADVLWHRDMIKNASVNNNTHYLTYDAYFYVADSSAPQAIEFDLNQFVNGRSLIFGSQCNIRAGNHVDVWDNVHSRWISTGIYCATPAAYKWHHWVLQVQRMPNNTLRYVSVTMDGQTHYINSYWASTGTGWTGITVNFQLDGNYRQQAYSVWVNKLTMRYQ